MIFTIPTQKQIVNLLVGHHLIRLKHKPQRVFLVGSFAAGTPHEDSDVDVLLILRQNKRWTDATLTEHYHRRLQSFFMRNHMYGKADWIHPQWCGRRVDVYFSFSGPKQGKPFVLLK